MTNDDAQRFIRGFLDALERFDAAAIGAIFADEVVHVEHPNALLPKGLLRDRDAMLGALASGRKTLASQRYEVTNLVADGDRVAFESDWVGTLAVPLGRLAAGDAIRAHFAVFLTLRDGKVVRWVNYDCFEPFA